MYIGLYSYLFVVYIYMVSLFIFLFLYTLHFMRLIKCSNLNYVVLFILLDIYLDVMLVKFTKSLCLTKYFLFQIKLATLLISIIPPSLLSRLWDSDSDVKLVILDAASTGSSVDAEMIRVEIECSLIISVSIGEVSPALIFEFYVW